MGIGQELQVMEWGKPATNIQYTIGYPVGPFRYLVLSLGNHPWLCWFLVCQEHLLTIIYPLNPLAYLGQNFVGDAFQGAGQLPQ